VQTYRQMVDEGVFAHQTRVGPADGNAQDANNTLLVTGSLMWDPNLAGMGFDSMAKQLYHHFSGATWTNDLFHAYGPVRTLFWVQTDDFSPMIAQASVGMQRGNQLLEMTQNMSLVVHSARKARAVGRGALGREPQYELESLVRALRSGRERGMDVAPHRRDVTYDLAKHIEESSGGTGISSVDSIFAYLRGQQLEGKPVTGLLLQSMIENIELEERLRSEHPDLPVDLTGSLTPTATRFVIRGHPAEKEITKFRKARAQITGVIQHKLMIEAAADLGEEMYRLECKALKMTEGSQKDSLIKQIEHLDMQWDQAITKLTDNYQSAPLTEVDDRISLRYPPYSRSQWDRRSFEPLIAHEYEAWPRNRISLVSASPKPKPRGDSDDWYEWALDFVHAIYDWPNRSIPVALDSMQHGLSDLVKDCPSLRDPDNGGRLQMKHLRVRMLTMKMIHELVQAYKNWPFKAPGTGHCRYFRHKGNRSTR
jgi:transcription factor 1